MKKLRIALLMLLFAGMQSLLAQDAAAAELAAEALAEEALAEEALAAEALAAEALAAEALAAEALAAEALAAEALAAEALAAEALAAEALAAEALAAEALAAETLAAETLAAETLAAETLAAETLAAEALAAEALAAEAAKTTTGGMLNLAVTPELVAEGRMYLAGEEQRKLNTPATDDDAKARITVAGDYNEIIGVLVELEGQFNKPIGDVLAFGDNAYAYVHVLQLFGIDPKILDVYLRSGRFDAPVGAEAKDAGQDTWSSHSDVEPLNNWKNVNMQLDLKILDMLSIRYVTTFQPFEQAIFSRKVSEVRLGKDMAVSLLFDKAFGPHQIMASAGYAFDLANNEGKTPEGNSKIAGKYKYERTTSFTPKTDVYFDDLAFSLAYAGTFGTIKLMPFFNMRIQGVVAYPNNSASAPRTNWSAGVKFQLLDANGGYDLIGAGLDMGGIFYEPRFTANNKRVEKGLEGIGLKLWSDVLKGIMGSQYLSFWAAVRFEFWDLPDADRSSYLSYWGFGLDQYFVNTADASVKLSAEFSVENIAPFKVENGSYVSGSGTTPTAVADTPFRVFVDLGLEASFTARITKQVN